MIFLKRLQLGALLFIAWVTTGTVRGENPPNIVYIMSDELAYFELGHMGNPYIKTPRIDQMAREGMRFTNALAGSPVCAPLRCNLMTGKHSGHASVRANDGGTPLREGEETIASMLKQKGYATGGFGKWGCGGRDSTGVPEKHGFDVFFGYYDQVHAHSFYTPYLIRNSEEVVLEGNVGGRTGKTYSEYPIHAAALQFIRENKERPFLCYMPITPPHGMYDIPADDPAWELYKNEAWMRDPTISQDTKNYAAMVSMVDREVGNVLDLLHELGLEDNTIVFFTGDNGGQDRFKSKEHPRGFFGPNVNPENGVEFRGGKGNLYEGGLKIPFLVRWPGVVAANTVRDLVFYQPDIMATIADLTNTKAPEDTDGISIAPTLLGADGSQKLHEMMYWEYGNQTAVRYGKWKAIQPGKPKGSKQNQPWELYDLSRDVSESISVADSHSDVLEKMKAFADASHDPVEAGTYYDKSRKRHERDRKAKWGTLREDQSPLKNAQRIPEQDIVPFEEMKLIRFSSENRTNDRLAEYAIDGKPSKVWHSQFSQEKKKHPHELVIDLGQTRMINGFYYLARQDKGWNGAFEETEFYVSDNADHFPEEPYLRCLFKKEKQAQRVEGDAIAARYVLVRNISEVSGNDFGSAADIAVILAK
ncbi:MAG: sulfatase-like hydrolase/transferase [Planctomycetaceae bacterium]|nr:sulfatase-like hydrolase/transferase [Planctomycetaceae bacterium]